MSTAEFYSVDRQQLAQATTLDGQGLKTLVEAALTWLKTNQQTVNALNVFPVPDGDTGTNMLLTLQAAYNEVANSGERNVGKMAHAIAQGALMGARGNSGVILSQIWRGFARGLDSLDVMDAAIMVRALIESRNTAYKGVVRPVEGTILTVIKDVSIAAEQALAETQDLNLLLEQIVQAADVSVKHTPELLPILKQAGVVDSGGKGLFFIFEGMLRYLKDQPLETATTTVMPLAAMQLEETMEAVEAGQDFEVVVDFRPNEPLNLESFYAELSEMGTSIQVGEGDGFYRMHIHVPTENRYLPIDYTMKIGAVTKVAIENLRAQMDDLQHAESTPHLQLTHVEPGQIAVVAVSPGMGISQIFASLGINAVVEGGQTMNPSTEQILGAFENLPTDQVIILPNNKNIVLAAQAAASMTVKKVAVIPSKSVPQGLSAMLRLNPEGDFDEVVAEMNEAITEVESGEITVATRSIEINGVSVKEGEVIALLNGQLIAAQPDLEKACLALLEKANTADRERITFFYGQNIGRAEVNRIVDIIRTAYPTHEIELHEGGQPHYQFILSIE
ncbi:MAG TPA: DAK2 domain-containing protein [Anaerolineaceae bacterium]|nr:DAK2 domain-containing protein [Anaerolineaceae bacterium]HNS36666.1 DAK2 domain-containing protein [Anaerolineaceae bacterium]HOD04027.1 DAK2 domain-containing protein [Anaerolineaceae bacterium]HQF63115.1 DAK2 domain-containing protein [Anaerolineaceae bacterium]HQH86101.1 DAK2 domain-containing protein [Anaerolineaceae bacterium]